MNYYVKESKGKYVKGDDGQRLILSETDKKLLQDTLKPHPYIYEVVVTDHMVHQIKNKAGNIISVDSIKAALRRADGEVDEAIRILRVCTFEFTRPQ